MAILGSESEDIPQEGQVMLEALLGTIGARYTMAREREVHRRYLPGSETEELTATVDGDDDDFDDGLF